MENVITWPAYGDNYTPSEFEDVFFKCIKDGNIGWLDTAKTDIRLNLNTRNDKGETPLLFAIRNSPDDKKTKIVKLLLSTPHIIVDWGDENGNTPLHESIQQDNADITLALLYKHADISQKNNDGNSPLDILSKKDCPEIKNLLKNNPPDWFDYQQLYTIKESAKHSSDLELSSLTKNNKQDSFIIEYKEACNDKSETRVIKLLTEATEADIHANHEFTLRWAAKGGHEIAVNFLIVKGADIHAWNDEALFWSIGNNHGIVASILLRNGANPMARGAKKFNKLLNKANTPPLREHILDNLIKLEQEKYPFSLKLKPSLSEKYFYHTKIKSVLKLKDKGRLATSLFQACKENYPWVVHQILKQNTSNDSMLQTSFKNTTEQCNDNKNSEEIVHVLLEHGLDAQKAIENYYMRCLSSKLLKDNQNIDFSNKIFNILEKFNGSIDIAKIKYKKTEKIVTKDSKYKKTEKVVIEYSNSIKPKGPWNSPFF